MPPTNQHSRGNISPAHSGHTTIHLTNEKFCPSLRHSRRTQRLDHPRQADDANDPAFAQSCDKLQATPTAAPSLQSPDPMLSAPFQRPALFPNTDLRFCISCTFLSVSTPFWPTDFPHEDFRPRPGTLFITRQSETNRRAWGHEQ
ncbi:hypothetical protein CDL15_Pgr023271 [Punica granatum]|uniref:Uncharacterized protein n=1 Tax=Punica granatum TaxID=22663 RepID=A0A218WIF1_PUNGR|nr:hypothetical protein CDL15_Pgr023271 [Punica granatum]PKI48961.1 hypothetical protein CRG98_030659 [Punica granatum]